MSKVYLDTVTRALLKLAKGIMRIILTTNVSSLVSQKIGANLGLYERENPPHTCGRLR